MVTPALIRPDRRALLTAGGASALWPGAAAASPYEDPDTKAIATYSESRMVMPATVFSMRFCRFPDAGVTWLWCHALVAGRIYAFSHHRLPTTGDRLNGQTDSEFAAVAPFGARMSREGSAKDVRRAVFEAELPVHRSNTAPHGPGAHRLKVRGHFTPAAAMTNQPLDRQELLGGGRLTLEIDGRTIEFASRGKFHEQAQWRPRFVDPFGYMGFWSADGGGQATRSLGPSTGAIQLGGRIGAVKTFQANRPADCRHLRLDLADGQTVTGEMEALARYTIPVFGERWRGSFVRGRIGGDEVRGVMNDWRNDKLPALGE